MCGANKVQGLVLGRGRKGEGCWALPPEGTLRSQAPMGSTRPAWAFNLGAQAGGAAHASPAPATPADLPAAPKAAASMQCCQMTPARQDVLPQPWKKSRQVLHVLPRPFFQTPRHSLCSTVRPSATARAPGDPHSPSPPP